MNEEAKKIQEIELLKLEYQECQHGYSQRDSLAEDEFGNVVQIFLLLVATVFLFDRFAEAGRAIHCLGCFVLGLAGLFYFFSLLVSIESNASCNVALRQRCEEIEKRLQELTGCELRYWRTIHDRLKHFEEKVFKGASNVKADKEKKERERNIFIHTIRLLIFLWIVVVLFTVFNQKVKQQKASLPDPSIKFTELDKPR